MARLAVVGAGAAVVAAGVVVATGGDDANAAYAVEAQDDGSVTVQIHKLEDADGLEAKLRAAGVPAVVKYLPIGKSCKEGWFQPVRGAAGTGSVSGSRQDGASGPTTFTIDPGTLGPDQTLVITTSTGRAPGPVAAEGAGELHMTAIGMAVAQGPVGECEVVTAPPVDVAPVPVGAGGGSVQRSGGPGETGPSFDVQQAP